MAGYVLGLDLGPNSIGWAMLDQDEQGNITGLCTTESAGHPPMGVRVFEAGLHNFETAKEESLNQARRTARSMRRNHARRNARRRQLKAQLTEAGLLPPDPAELSQLMQEDPYALRAKALVQPLLPHELGRALFHLGQRRGFKSNRKSGDAKEDEGILLEIGQLEAAIKACGCQTLGEYLNHLQDSAAGPGFPRLRHRHTRRDMYEREFDAILAVQRPELGNLVTDELAESLHHTIFFQHPFEVTEERRALAPSRANLHRSPSVRPCPLEPQELCAPKGAWLAQEFRILKEVANLKVSEFHRPDRNLTDLEREAILDKLRESDRVPFDALRKITAKLGTDPEARFNLERGDRKALLGNSVEHKLATAFGRKPWRELRPGQQDNLREGLVGAENPEDLQQMFLGAGLDPAKAEKLAKWAPADGYLGYSLLAISKILPHLEAGDDEYIAIGKAYPDRPEWGCFERLPTLSSPGLPPALSELTNPVVRRGLVELRKVVNALIREHGLPNRIVVELAREMKDGPQKRKDASRQLRERETLRKDAAVQVEQFGGNPNSREDINRWLYWKEQDGLCAYSGRSIPANELFHGGEWEVDHILPRWRSLDDSMMNKVLVHRETNAAKGDRTPAEWLGKDSEEFQQLIRRAAAAVKKGALPYPKFSRLKQEEVGTDDFASRQLNDTRYLTRAVIQYLSLLYPPELRTGEKALQSCRGGLTAELRRQWGLNNVLSPLYNADGAPVLSAQVDAEGVPYKSRADHRHHAVDAIVVALSSRGLLKRYQDYWQDRTRHPVESRPEFPLPWTGFREDVKFQASQITVSHRAMRKLSGALHEETFYGPAKDRNGQVLADRFVTRKPLAGLTGKNVGNIRDAVIRELISTRLRESGWDGKANVLPKNWWNRPLTMPSGMPITKVRIEVPIKNAAQLKHRFAVLGNNHHLEVIGARTPGEDRRMWGRTVSMMEAAARAHGDENNIIERFSDEGREFVTSLSRKESISATNPITGERTVCVVQIISGSPKWSSTIDLTIRDARDSRPASEGNRTPFKRLGSFVSWATLGIQKIQVDPLGRITQAND